MAVRLWVNYTPVSTKSHQQSSDDQADMRVLLLLLRKPNQISCMMSNDLTLHYDRSRIYIQSHRLWVGIWTRGHKHFDHRNMSSAPIGGFLMDRPRLEPQNPPSYRIELPDVHRNEYPS